MLRENIPDLADLELVAAVADKAVRVKQLLHDVARDYAPAVFANSLGAEDMVLTDIEESYVLLIEHAVLHFKQAAPATDANATLTLTKPIFIKMMTGTAGVQDTLLSDELEVDGSRIDLVRFFTLIDKAPGTFAIVTTE